MNVLFVGDVVGRPGREHLSKNLRRIKKENNIDFCICNGENSAHGNGATADTARELFDAGADIVTMGNHTFNNDAQKLFDDTNFVIRPINFPKSLPGDGSIIYDNGKVRFLVINAQGRVYMDPVDSPFDACIKEIESNKDKCDVIIVDFHCEATSEKGAMGHFLDGKVNAVIGTHTHVQTADEKLLPGGTAFITDVGMTGAVDSVLGVDKNIIVDRFARFINKRFTIAEGPVTANCVIIEIDDKTFKTTSIKRLNF